MPTTDTDLSTAPAGEAVDTSAEDFLKDLDGTGEETDTTLEEDLAADATPETPKPTPAPDASAKTADAPASLAETEPTPPLEGTPEYITAEMLKTAVPFTYTVDGQPLTTEFITEFPGEGLTIEGDKVEPFRAFVGQAESAIRQNAVLTQQVEQFQTAGGLQKIAELEAKAAMLDAAGGELVKAFSDPALLAQLAQDPDRLALFLEKIQFLAEKTQRDAGQKFQTDFTAKQETARQGPLREAKFTGLIREVQQVRPELTPDDLKAMAKHFSQFQDRMFRPATPEEAQRLGVRPGAEIFDPRITHAWIEDRSALRLSQAEQARKTETASKENAARLSTKTTTTTVRRTNGRPGAGKPPATPGAAGAKPTWSQIQDNWARGQHFTPDPD